MSTFSKRLDKIEKRLIMKSTQKSVLETVNEMDAYFEATKRVEEALPDEERHLRAEISEEAGRITVDASERAGIEDSLTEMIYYLRNKPKIEEQILQEHGLKTVDELIEENKTDAI